MCVWMQHSIELALIQSGVTHNWLDHAPSYGAASSQKVLAKFGLPVLKNILVFLPTGPAIVVIPAHHRLDLSRLEKVAAAPVRLGTSQEAWALFSDCEFGVIPPLGTLYRISTLWEDCLFEMGTAVMRGNTTTRSFVIGQQYAQQSKFSETKKTFFPCAPVPLPDALRLFILK